MRKFVSKCCHLMNFTNINLFNFHNYSTLSTKKICIVGSGPGGFYTAQHLLKNKSVEVDIFDKIPVPFGLIRYGVAPDHPDIKNVTQVFTKIASNERCRFYGNINVGIDITVPELLKSYDAVVLAYGASKDKKLDIPGEDSRNILGARNFVGWYTGHPEYMDVKVDLDTETVVVIGNGNVAVDVSRVLLRSVDELMKTDISQNALEALSKSRVKKVVMIGRRGPLQAAYTIKEFREMTKLDGCNMIISMQDVGKLPEVIPTLDRPAKRLAQLMYDTAVKEINPNNPRTFEVKFLRSPKLFVPDSKGRVEKCIFSINEVNDMLKDVSVISTPKEEIIESGLVLRSVGYYSVSIDPALPFNSAKNILMHKKGRVLHEDGSCYPGLYCSGWVKSGPVGVIISTMSSSYQTGESLLDDIENGDLIHKPTTLPNSVLDKLKSKGVKYTTFQDWLKIDEIELAKGKDMGKQREKFYTVGDMLHAINM